MKTANCYHKDDETCALCVPLFGKHDPKNLPDRMCGGPWGRAVADLRRRPTFERCADATLDEKVKPIYAGRGEQYGDSWDTKNGCTHFTNEMYRMLEGIRIPSPEELRLLQLAALIDVKISRMTGGYREDTVVDLIAYLAVYRTLREEYEAA